MRATNFLHMFWLCKLWSHPRNTSLDLEHQINSLVNSPSFVYVSAVILYTKYIIRCHYFQAEDNETTNGRRNGEQKSPPTGFVFIWVRRGWPVTLTRGSEDAEIFLDLPKKHKLVLAFKLGIFYLTSLFWKLIIQKTLYKPYCLINRKIYSHLWWEMIKMLFLQKWLWTGAYTRKDITQDPYT